jgi:hypothetical protein
MGRFAVSREDETNHVWNSPHADAHLVGVGE